MRPVLFLDIDGVINSVPAPKRHQIEANGAYSHRQVLDYPIWFNVKVVDFINSIHREEKAEIIWLTTWTHQARTDFAPAVGLDDFTHIGNRDGSDNPADQDWWKYKRAREYMAQQPIERRIIWIDDDLRRWVKEAFWREFDYERERCLFIMPNENPGITVKHMEEIRRFIDG